MARIDFITLSKIIFKEKQKYKSVSDEDKELSFFMLNRKFAFKFLKQAQFFNNKYIDRAKALDVWRELFYDKTNGTPRWWWNAKSDKKEKFEFKNPDLKLIKEYYELTDNDINFLSLYYKDKLKDNIKRIKKFKG